MTYAEEVMIKANRNGLIGVEDDGTVVMIEDVSDPDGRMYRLEHRCTADAKHAIAFCRHNPWGGVQGNEDYDVGHVSESGFICLGPEHRGQRVIDSPYPLMFAIRRARFWVTAFSVLKETGRFPLP